MITLPFDFKPNEPLDLSGSLQKYITAHQGPQAWAMIKDIIQTV